MKKKTIVLISAFVLLALVVAAAVVLIPKVKAYMPYYYDKNGKNQEDKPYTLTIDKSDFENEVASRLAENGVICSSIRFLNYIKKEYPDFVWYNGIYHLNANMSYKDLCEALMEPDVKLDYVKVVVPEGKTVAEIAKIVGESGLCTEKEFLDAADSYDYDYSFIDELKNRKQHLIGYKLEGYLFPATYEFRADTVTPQKIVDKMLKTFSEYVTDDMIKKAGDMGLTVNEYVSLAAVIQDEAFGEESMSGVSSVFWNRLNSSAYPRLESDPTMFYADDLKSLPHYSSDMKRAYSTYSCSGLPVGPTNCPGSEALNAVLNPSETEYYFFVTDKNGKFYFNKTLADHNKTIRSLKNQGLWA